MQCQECKHKFKLPKATRKYAKSFKTVQVFCPVCGSNNVSWSIWEK